MSVVEFPGSGLSEADYEALKAEVGRRLARGLPGHLTRGFSETGAMWAAIVEQPGGPPLHQFCRDKGVYYLVDYSGPPSGRLVDASRSFREILKHLPKGADARPGR